MHLPLSCACVLSSDLKKFPFWDTRNRNTFDSLFPSTSTRPIYSSSRYTFNIMLPLSSRLAAHARSLGLSPNLITRSVYTPFPRRPAFFSTTCMRMNSTTTTTSTSSTSSPDNETNDAPPAPSNLDSHPESVACTVSPPDTYAFLKPTPVVLLTGPFGGNW